MKKSILVVLYVFLFLSEGFAQEKKPLSILGKWEAKEESEEKLIFIFDKESKFTMTSSSSNPKRIDTGRYIFEKFDKNFKLTTLTKLGGLNTELKMKYLITFIDANTWKLEIADPDDHGEFAELAASFTAIFIRKEN